MIQSKLIEAESAQALAERLASFLQTFNCANVATPTNRILHVNQSECMVLVNSAVEWHGTVVIMYEGKEKL